MKKARKKNDGTRESTTGSKPGHDPSGAPRKGSGSTASGSRSCGFAAESSAPATTERKSATTGPRLVFSFEAVTQLRWFLQRTPNEVACWGVCDDPENPLRITRLAFPEQSNSTAYVEMDDISNVKLLARHASEGLQPFQCQRIWIHTHPGSSASPSGTDHSTLDRISENAPWFVMFIMAKGGQTTCKLRCHYEHPVTRQTLREDTEIPVFFECIPSASGVTPKDVETWEQIYQECCNERAFQPQRNLARVGPAGTGTPLPGMGHVTKSSWTDTFTDHDMWQDKDDEFDGVELEEDEIDILNDMTTPAQTLEVPDVPPIVMAIADMTLMDVWELTPAARELLFTHLRWEFHNGTD